MTKAVGSEFEARGEWAMKQKNRSVPTDVVVAHVVYEDLAKAIPWLERAFGFSEHFRYGDGPNGAQMYAGNAVIMLSEARQGRTTPAKAGGWTQALTILVDDVDGHHARTRAAGAKIVEEPHETEYGEYQYAAEDFAGHLWIFSRHAKDLAPEDWGGISRP